MNNRKLLFIRWNDARGVNADWQDLEDCQKDEMMDYVIESVGFLIRETSTAIHIAPHIQHTENQYCGDMQIPKSSIIDNLEIIDHKPITTAELHTNLDTDHDNQDPLADSNTF